MHINVVAGHAHLSAFGQGDDAGNVGGTEVELRTIVVEEGGMTATLFLGQNINLAMELGVRMDGAGLGQNLAALDVGLVDAAQQAADVVASLSELEALAEHFQTSDGGGQLLLISYCAERKEMLNVAEETLIKAVHEDLNNRIIVSG